MQSQTSSHLSSARETKCSNTETSKQQEVGVVGMNDLFVSMVLTSFQSMQTLPIIVIPYSQTAVSTPCNESRIWLNSLLFYLHQSGKKHIQHVNRIFQYWHLETYLLPLVSKVRQVIAELPWASPNSNSCFPLSKSHTLITLWIRKREASECTGSKGLLYVRKPNHG